MAELRRDVEIAVRTEGEISVGTECRREQPEIGTCGAIEVNDTIHAPGGREYVPVWRTCYVSSGKKRARKDAQRSASRRLKCNDVVAHRIGDQHTSTNGQ